jgi:hypothetical protein
MNFIAGQMEMTTGLYGLLPRYETRRPTVNATVGPVACNNITVADSVVGSINTGDVKQIDVAMDHIKQRGDVELATAMKTLTEAVLNAADIDKTAKDEIVEQLSFVVGQLALPKEERRAGLVKPVLVGLAEAVNASASLMTIWEKVGPMISGALGG